MVVKCKRCGMELVAEDRAQADRIHAAIRPKRHDEPLWMFEGEEIREW